MVCTALCQGRLACRFLARFKQVRWGDWLPGTELFVFPNPMSDDTEVLEGTEDRNSEST